MFATLALNEKKTLRSEKRGGNFAARALSALPVTQVSVERPFSALKIILSDTRSRLKADLVEAILFLRTNSKNVSCCF